MCLSRERLHYTFKKTLSPTTRSAIHSDNTPVKTWPLPPEWRTLPPLMQLLVVFLSSSGKQLRSAHKLTSMQRARSNDRTRNTSHLLQNYESAKLQVFQMQFPYSKVTQTPQTNCVQWVYKDTSSSRLKCMEFIQQPMTKFAALYKTDKVKVKSSMARSLPVKNLLPQKVGSIINYFQ